VDVVGHYDERIQFNEREMVRDVFPTTLGNLACLVQPHFTVHHMPKEAFPLAGASGDETRAGLGVIVSLEADGTAMVFVGYPCPTPFNPPILGDD
jgi:hypothetical protein